jgi:ABC-type microcin C transport system permease subunit YejB
MPVYDWDANGVPVIKKGFKYYWAVTIPLTAVVLLSWGVVTLLPWRAWVARISKSGKRNDEIGLT